MDEKTDKCDNQAECLCDPKTISHKKPQLLILIFGENSYYFLTKISKILKNYFLEKKSISHFKFIEFGEKFKKDIITEKYSYDITETTKKIKKCNSDIILLTLDFIDLFNNLNKQKSYNYQKIYSNFVKDLTSLTSRYNTVAVNSTVKGQHFRNNNSCDFLEKLLTLLNIRIYEINTIIKSQIKYILTDFLLDFELLLINK